MISDLTYKYADDSTSLSSKENLSTSLEKAENYTYNWRQVLNKDKTEHINFSKEVFQSAYKLVERSKILGLWFARDLSFKTHAAIISASVVNFWKETSILLTQGLNAFYAVRIFDSYVKMWWSVHKSIFVIRNYQVLKHVVSVLGNIWHPSLLYTNQVFLFPHSTARSADFLNPGNLAIIPQHIKMVRLFLVHKLSFVNRDPNEIKAIYI